MLNLATLIGNVGKEDATLRYTPQGTPVATFSFATNESFKDKDQKWQTRTTWFKCTVWGKFAEAAAKNITSGRKLYIAGPVGSEAWIDNNDGKAKSTSTITVREIRYLDSTGKEEELAATGTDGQLFTDEVPE